MVPIDPGRGETKYGQCVEQRESPRLTVDMTGTTSFFGDIPVSHYQAKHIPGRYHGQLGSLKEARLPRGATILPKGCARDPAVPEVRAESVGHS